MTEKRYKLIRPHYHSHFFDSKEERNLSWYEIIDLLNENEQLKKDLLEVHEICAYYESRIKELKR